MSKTVFPPLDRLLPHAPPMRLLDALVAYDERSATCEAHLFEGHPFADAGGAVLTLTCIELLAQTAAALMGYRGFLRGGGVVAGMLVGVPRFDARVAHLRVGDRLVCTVQEQFTMGRSTQLDGQVTRDGAIVCEGTLNVIVGGPSEGEAA